KALRGPGTFPFPPVPSQRGLPLADSPQGSESPCPGRRSPRSSEGSGGFARPLPDRGGAGPSVPPLGDPSPCERKTCLAQPGDGVYFSRTLYKSPSQTPESMVLEPT